MTEAHPGRMCTCLWTRACNTSCILQLREAVDHHRAKSASAMVIDTRTGEILALSTTLRTTLRFAQKHGSNLTLIQPML